MLRVIGAFFDTKFVEASAFCDLKGKGSSEIADWARKEFGESDSFTLMLISEQEWTGDLIRMRNAVEHLGGMSGTLHIQNVTLSRDGRFVLPTWHRDDGEVHGLFPDLETYMDNMLTLGEDTLVNCVRHRPLSAFIDFVEIRVADRNPDCPQRLTVQMKGQGLGQAAP
jgi:hypothetical protein